MSEQDWENIIDQAAVLGCRALQFIGGEPTMHPALPALIERARVRVFETVEVYTTARCFTRGSKKHLLGTALILHFQYMQQVRKFTIE
jgi:uncharacterized radical SAM superfamily Fe-S cluster-containing enzyme